MKLTFNLRVRVFSPGNKHFVEKLMLASPGCYWSESDIDGQLDRIAADIEKQFPREEYRLVQIGRGRFNFVHAGRRLEHEEKDVLEQVTA